MSTSAYGVDRLVARLLAVRDGGALIDPVPSDLAPVDLAAAYAVADRLALVLAQRLGPVSGYKIGATSAGGQRTLGLSEPFFGRTFAQQRLADGSAFEARGREYTVEAEVGFVVGRDLPPRARPYTPAEVHSALASAVPLLEINRPSYAKPLEIGGLWLVADNGVTQGVVVGLPGASAAAASSVALETVQLTRNGTACAEGSAQVVLGDPLRAVAWLANALRARGLGLRAGEVVASGAMTPPIPVAAGDELVATYGTLGRVRLAIGREAG